MSAASYLCRPLLQLKKTKPIIAGTIKRSSHYTHPHNGYYGSYRMDLPPITYGPKIKIVRFFQVLMWWHIFYSFWYDPWIVFGHPEFQPPDATLWTDEELGIPPDDYDEVL